MKLTILRHPIFWITTAALLVCWALPAQAVRIKDIATFSGVRDNQLIGYGLVVGLAGTGDKKDSVFTLSSMKNMMDRMGVGVDASALKIKNVASVMVTARMPVSFCFSPHPSGTGRPGRPEPGRCLIVLLTSRSFTCFARAANGRRPAYPLPFRPVPGIQCLRKNPRASSSVG